MKKNLVFKTLESKYVVNKEGLVVYHESIIEFTKEEIHHKSRKIEWWNAEKKKSITLLTNNFTLSEEEIVEIYRRRWAIELLFKQLKQNFPLKYFYGDSVNSIQSQIWVTLIANLLLSVVKHQVHRRWSFSNLCTLITQMLMYYVDLYKY